MQASKRLQPLFPIERFPAMAQFVDDQYEMLIPNTLTAKDIYKHLKAAKENRRGSSSRAGSWHFLAKKGGGVIPSG